MVWKGLRETVDVDRVYSNLLQRRNEVSCRRGACDDGSDGSRQLLHLGVIDESDL